MSRAIGSALVLLLSAGTPEERFEALDNLPPVHLTGPKTACLLLAAQEFKTELASGRFKKYGSNVSDFNAFIIEKDTRCIVEFAPTTGVTGSGVQYWIEGGKVERKQYTK
ncbi:MAG: hypothetical protein JNK82_41860 [Myxococcaceae bacterium]|nr:hypothetical protein [Myxococcaceae bacterium]